MARLKRGLLIGAGAVLIALAIPAASGAATRQSKTVDVTERDFHVTAPATFPKGDVTVDVRNLGPDDHEFIVVRGSKPLPLRRDGLTVSEEKLEKSTVGALEPGRAGANRKLHLDLKPGHYEVFCNMSGHYLGGMHRTFVVKP